MTLVEELRQIIQNTQGTKQLIAIEQLIRANNLSNESFVNLVESINGYY